MSERHHFREPKVTSQWRGQSPDVGDPGVIDALDALERYARAFDAISDEQDARYSARSFVRWVRLEATAPPLPSGTQST